MASVRTTPLPGAVEITPPLFEDDRGYFFESFNERKLQEVVPHRFVQDNQSFSRTKGTVRGLHYQMAPRAQAKLIRVIRGAIWDVCVDIRRSSATFGQWFGLELTGDRRNQLFIPPGFAHGFITLCDDVEVAYKVSDFHSPEHDRAIRFDDPSLGIAWPDGANVCQISDKDRDAPSLDDAELFD